MMVMRALADVEAAERIADLRAHEHVRARIERGLRRAAVERRVPGRHAVDVDDGGRC